MKTFKLTEKQFREMRNDNGGYCTSCGADIYEIEPDAREYECEICGMAQVYGIEELLIMGLIKIIDDEKKGR